ncbi:MAG: phosphotransferase, partial [Burkholderiaceae bacterium]
MAVFTQVSEEAAQALLDRLNLGTLQSLRGIEGGIENTNYFATSSEGEFVLTLFERLTHEQLPFYLHLMKHLAQRGIPVPDPAADARGEL